MMPRTVEVNAPSRLHFGLMSFGYASGRQYGGVGAMIDRPGLRLRISNAEHFDAEGPHAERVRAIVQTSESSQGHEGLPPCRIEVLEAPPDHVGLGTGTQLALAVAAGLQAWREQPPLDAAKLAHRTRRAERSAVGTYGFLMGGLIYERGKLPGEIISPLAEHVVLPEAWRFVLIVPERERGLAGEQERAAFDALPPVDEAIRRALADEIESRMLPAARAGDFAAFGESLYRYGYQAGLCFAARQGGAFASPRVASLVEHLRGRGVRGVGQSSWGPTVFALCQDGREAAQIGQELAATVDAAQIVVAQASRGGARISRLQL